MTIVTDQAETIAGADANPAEQRLGDDFERLAGPFRPEILALCYRMLGSLHDAEDIVQETYLRGWRSYGAFEGRASLRTWLYRIGTNACLTALEHRARRPLPAGIGAPSSEPEGDLSAIPPEIHWLQPLPDAMLAVDSAAADPASVVAARSGLRLALVAALQYLPPRQRAVLILRDVLGWRAAEVADLLGMSTAAVNSLLKRARARLSEAGPDIEDVREPSEASQREILDRWARAFVEADVEALMALVTQDAAWEMPPQPMWFQGADMVRRLLAFRLRRGGQYQRMIPTSANGQPAFAVYRAVPNGQAGTLVADSLQVLTFRGSRIARVSAFRTPELFTWAGLPMALGSDSASAPSRRETPR